MRIGTRDAAARKVVSVLNNVITIRYMPSSMRAVDAPCCDIRDSM